LAYKYKNIIQYNHKLIQICITDNRTILLQ